MNTLDILIDIRKIVRSINIESKRIQRDFGISIPQLICLGHMHTSPQFQTTHGDLMKLLSLNSSTITGIINRLEKKGYVRRITARSDRRITIIGLTAKGRRLVERAPAALHDQLSTKLQSLPEHDHEGIRQALQIIVEAMNIQQVDAAALITGEDPIHQEDTQKGD